MSTQAVTTVVETEAEIKAAGLQRFGEAFSLEAEVVGKGYIRKTASASGAVKATVISKKDLGKETGLKGGDLLKKLREITDGFKGNMAVGFAKLISSPEWTGKGISMNKAGDTITFSLKKEGRPVVTEISTSDAVKALGVKAGKEEEAVKILKAMGMIETPNSDATDVTSTTATEAAPEKAADPLDGFTDAERAELLADEESKKAAAAAEAAQ